MRILSAVEGSVLLLNNINDSFKNNIFKNLHINNILKERIIFLKREETFKKHIARQKLADLFLDTSPYNAHTTASDALLVGLPILTKIGKTFPARVSASLLTAIGLEELITKSSEEYEKKAIELAQDPKKLQEIKAKLLQNKETYPLFNTSRFTKNIECLYVEIKK
jgi:predicted O-linked N-acetylglucosamine transferase (SPINDLY family)